MDNDGDLEARVRELEAIHQIMNLESDYAYADDTHDSNLYASVFTEDGVIDFGAPIGRIAGRESLRRFLKSDSTHPFSMHCWHNPHIVVDGETAKGRFYWEASMTWAPTNEAVLIGGVSHDEFTKTDEGWKIKQKTITMHYFTPYDKGWVKERVMDLGTRRGNPRQ